MAALVVATALPARALANAAGDAVPGLRISFVKSLGLVRSLWLTLDLSGLTFDRSLCSGLRSSRSTF